MNYFPATVMNTMNLIRSVYRDAGASVIRFYDSRLRNLGCDIYIGLKITRTFQWETEMWINRWVFEKVRYSWAEYYCTAHTRVRAHHARTHHTHTVYIFYYDIGLIKNMNRVVLYFHV